MIGRLLHDAHSLYDAPALFPGEKSLAAPGTFAVLEHEGLRRAKHRLAAPSASEGSFGETMTFR
jgi:hypothetical protein